MPASDLSVTGRWDTAEVQYSAKDGTGASSAFQNATLKNALAACAQYGGIINLLMNVELPADAETMVIPANVALSGNYTYYNEATSAFETTISAISVADGGYLPNAFSLGNGSTISQMTLTGCGISVSEGAAATLASCTLTGCRDNAITNAGSLTLSGCTITGNTFAASTGSLIVSTGR